MEQFLFLQRHGNAASATPRAVSLLSVSSPVYADDLEASTAGAAYSGRGRESVVYSPDEVNGASACDICPHRVLYVYCKRGKASAADASVSWRVVFAHRPAYCSTSDYYDCKQAGPKKIRPALAPLFEQYGVDLFLAGHLHNYERSFPVSASGEVLRESYNWTAAQQREEQKEEEEAVARVGGAPKVKQGTVHMVIGNAGDNEGLTYVWEQPKPSWVAFRNTTLGWARITARDEKHMLVEMVESGNVGRVIDSFTLVKP